MRTFFRLGGWILLLILSGITGLGLWNSYHGRPALDTQVIAGKTRQTLDRGLELLWEPSSQRPAEEHPISPSAAGNSLSALRRAIGCGPPDDPAADPGTTRSVYRWRDEEGVVNFTDAPGAGPQAKLEHQNVYNSNDAFYTSIEIEDAVLPGPYHGHLNAGTRRIYDQWRDWLGDSAIVRSHVKVRFVGDGEKFARLWGKGDGDGWTPTGFYRIRNNEAVVLFSPGYRRDALATAFHEVSHLITAWHLGPSPVWLNEGIAEYFETMDVAWQEARFRRNRQHLALLRNQGLVPLDELIAIAGRDWTAKDPYRRYASAWSFIAFLMDSRTGRETLQNLIRSAHAQRCGPRMDLQESLTQYPGGRQSLEADWQRWVRET